LEIRVNEPMLSIMKSHDESNHADTKIQLALISGKDRYSGDGTGLDECSGITLGTFQVRPESRGCVHVKSRDPSTAPLIEPNYLREAVDRKLTVAGLRLIREVAEQPDLKKFIKREILPGTEISSDAALLEYAGETGQTSWHPIGTCRMGNDPGAVVDPELRVRGVDGLRVADASIMPTMVSTNTNAPSMLIGEKAADLIKDSNI
jgi:choline dehydrogenase